MEDDDRGPSAESRGGPGRSGTELVFQPAQAAEPADDLGARMLAIERKLGRQTTWLAVLTLVLVASVVAGLVALHYYVPTVHVAATPTGAGATPPVSTTSSPPVTLGIRPDSGPGSGGNRVTVLGLNLQNATSVSFGTVRATTFTVNALGNSIVAFAPARAAGAVDVTVTTPAGTSAVSAADQYIYVGPTVARVTPKSGPGGSAVSVIGSDLSGASAVEFGGTPATNFSVNGSGTRITVIAPSQGPGSVPVTVTTPGGVSAASATATFTYS